jgi:hypothetical protein
MPKICGTSLGSHPPLSTTFSRSAPWKKKKHSHWLPLLLLLLPFGD